LDESLTVSQIARWRFVSGRVGEMDHSTACPMCHGHNRVRLALVRTEVERVTCLHFLRYEFNSKEKVVYFVFAAR
jgi:hypothetical protein